MTQLELARNTGIEQPNLSAYENDRQVPSMDTLNRILVGCGYLLEATSGERRILCPLPDGLPTSTADSPSVSADEPSPSSVTTQQPPDDAMSARKLEQVLALAEAIRTSRAD